MSASAYDRAVATFAALARAPAGDAPATPGRIIREAGLSASSGYRAIAALEAEDMLRRDGEGAYLRGTASLRTGLSAFGLGRYAPVVPPVLLRLREATQHTAFLAVMEGADMRMGPFLPGRETRRARLAPAYRMEIPRALPPGEATEAGLTTGDGGIAQRLQTLLCPVEADGSRIPVLGLVLDPARPTDAFLPRALVEATEQIAQ